MVYLVSPADWQGEFAQRKKTLSQSRRAGFSSGTIDGVSRGLFLL
jgi:hypothetical protein